MILHRDNVVVNEGSEGLMKKGTAEDDVEVVG